MSWDKDLKVGDAVFVPIPENRWEDIPAGWAAETVVKIGKVQLTTHTGARLMLETGKLVGGGYFKRGLRDTAENRARVESDNEDRADRAFASRIGQRIEQLGVRARMYRFKSAERRRAFKEAVNALGGMMGEKE